MPTTLDRLTPMTKASPRSAVLTYREGATAAGTAVFTNGKSTFSTAFFAGDLLKFDASGRVVRYLDLATSSGSAGTSTSTSNSDGTTPASVVGIALQDARLLTTAQSNAQTGTGHVKVIAVDDNTQFLMPLWADSGPNYNHANMVPGFAAGVTNVLTNATGSSTNSSLQQIAVDLDTSAVVAHNSTGHPKIVQIVNRVPAVDVTESYTPVWVNVLQALRAIR